MGIINSAKLYESQNAITTILDNPKIKGDYSLRTWGSPDTERYTEISIEPSQNANGAIAQVVFLHEEIRVFKFPEVWETDKKHIVNGLKKAFPNYKAVE
jgi:hypothetical protein